MHAIYAVCCCRDVVNIINMQLVFIYICWLIFHICIPHKHMCIWYVCSFIWHNREFVWILSGFQPHHNPIVVKKMIFVLETSFMWNLPKVTESLSYEFPSCLHEKKYFIYETQNAIELYAKQITTKNCIKICFLFVFDNKNIPLIGLSFTGGNV